MSEKQFKCIYCDAEYDDKESIDRHVEYAHTLYKKGNVEKTELTAWQVAKISSIETEKEQDEFADYLVDNNIPSGRPTEKALKRFKNKTIYTIGYEGKNVDEFIQHSIYGRYVPKRASMVLQDPLEPLEGVVLYPQHVSVLAHVVPPHG